jgi:Ser/Thr protein kinase RdoA (MazF antagonist)
MPGDDGGRIAEMTRAGLAAAVRVARGQGLPGDDPEVLSSRGNVVVHGLAVSLWTWMPPSPARPGPAEVGEALARLHLTAAGFPGELPVLSPLRDLISDGLAVLEREQAVDPAVLAALRDRHAAILAELDGVTGTALVLHGDAHAGNLLRAGGAVSGTGPDSGWLWIDLEETCRGPRAFDLAVVADHQGAGAGATLAAYAAVTGEPLPEPEVLALFTRARRLEGAVWTLGMAYQYPARYLEPARFLLADVLGQGVDD